MQQRSRASILTLLSSLLLVAVGFFVWSWMYPFGRRAALLPSMWGGLSAYASDHGGWFPDSKFGAYDALTMLYRSNYCTSDELAGVSGDINAARSALGRGDVLTETTTSWMYSPGLRIDDRPDVAILWERTAGYYWNGRRNMFGGRPVLFVTGNVSNVPASEWQPFLHHQDELHRLLKQERNKSQTKQDTNPRHE